MTISIIKMKNFKGETREQELSGLDLFIGPNGIGKSSNLQAPLLTLLGYIPGKGKTNNETFKNASDITLEVGIKTDKGIEVTRQFKKGTSVSEDIIISPLTTAKKTNEKSKEIQNLLGTSSINLDFNEFLGKTDSDKRSYIYSLAGSTSSFTKEKVEEYLCKKLLTKELEEQNINGFNNMRGIIQDLISKWPQKPIEEALKIAIDYCSDKLTYWKKEKTTLESANKSLLDSKNSKGEIEGDIIANKAALESLQKELIDIEKKISKNYEVQKANKLKVDRMSYLNTEIQKLEVENSKINPSTIKQQITLLSEKIVDTTSITSNIATLKKDIVLLKANYKNLKKNFDDITTEGMKEASDIKAFEDILEKLKNHTGVCAINSKVPCNQDFSSTIAKMEKEDIPELQLKKKKLKVNFLKVQKDLKELELQITTKEEEREKLLDEERADAKSNDLIRNKIESLNKELNELTVNTKIAEEKLTLYKNELDKLKNDPLDTVLPDNIMTASRNSIKNKIGELKLKIDAQAKVSNNAIELKNTQIKLTEAEYYADNYKSLVAALGVKGVQGEIVKETMLPIKEEIQYNLSALGVKDTFYFSTISGTGKEHFQFGWIKDKKTINFDTLSTAQQLLTIIAMTVAFLNRTNAKEKLLTIDNLEHFDKDNLKNALKGLGRLKQEGKIDNVLLAGVLNITKDKFGEFKVIDLSKKSNSNNEKVEESLI